MTQFLDGNKLYCKLIPFLSLVETSKYLKFTCFQSLVHDVIWHVFCCDYIFKVSKLLQTIFIVKAKLF